MPIVEVRCPNCGAQCSIKNETIGEYQCNYCGTIFRFIDTTKKEIIRDIRKHNCPICGRPIKAEEGSICTECGKQYFCSNCIEEIEDYKTHFRKIVCKECLRKKRLSCDECSDKYEHQCIVCTKQYCDKHTKVYMDFSVQVWRKDPLALPFALYCPNCVGYVCRECSVEKASFLGSKAYYCKKCGAKLRAEPPLSRELFDAYLKMR